MEKVLIGWAEESLVPDMKVALAGQFYERISEYVESDITATAMAIDNGEENYNELDFSTLLNEGIASSVNTAANRYIKSGCSNNNIIPRIRVETILEYFFLLPK